MLFSLLIPSYPVDLLPRVGKTSQLLHRAHQAELASQSTQVMLPLKPLAPRMERPPTTQPPLLPRPLEHPSQRLTRTQSSPASLPLLPPLPLPPRVAAPAEEQYTHGPPATQPLHDCRQLPLLQLAPLPEVDCLRNSGQFELPRVVAPPAQSLKPRLCLSPSEKLLGEAT